MITFINVKMIKYNLYLLNISIYLIIFFTNTNCNVVYDADIILLGRGNIIDWNLMYIFELFYRLYIYKYIILSFNNN